MKREKKNIIFMDFVFHDMIQTYMYQLPGNSITTSHNVGILFNHKRRGVIKWPAYGTRRRICLEAKEKK